MCRLDSKILQSGPVMCLLMRPRALHPATFTSFDTSSNTDFKSLLGVPHTLVKVNYVLMEIVDPSTVGKNYIESVTTEMNQWIMFNSVLVQVDIKL